MDGITPVGLMNIHMCLGAVLEYVHVWKYASHCVCGYGNKHCVYTCQEMYGHLASTQGCTRVVWFKCGCLYMCA